MTAAPKRWSVLRLVLLSLLLMLGACSQPHGGTQPQDGAPVVIPPPGTDNEYLLAVGQLEPNFGGLFLDGATLNIYLLNAATASQVEKDRVVRSLVRVYGDTELGSYRPKFLKGDYAMVDLYAWYQKLTKLLAVEGVSFTDLDEGRNRLAVGVVDASLVPEVRSEVARLEIPADAVIIEEQALACPAIGWFPVAAEVRDAEGRPAAIGATVTLTREGYEASSLGFGDPLVILAGDSVGGTFDVEVSKPYFESATVAGVEVPTDDCGVGETVTVEVTLTLQPDAPPVRQVVVAPYGLGLGGAATPDRPLKILCGVSSPRRLERTSGAGERPVGVVRAAVFEDAVDDVHQLPHHRADHDHLGLTFRAEPSAESLHRRTHL